MDLPETRAATTSSSTTCTCTSIGSRVQKKRVIFFLFFFFSLALITREYFHLGKLLIALLSKAHARTDARARGQ